MPADLRQLTAFRAFAAAWVVLYDFLPLLRPEASFGPLPRLFAKGYLGVELFFVLSGFILSHVYAESWREGRFRYRAFLWARLARIYPLHLAMLAAIGLVIAAGALVGIRTDHLVVSAASLPANLTLTNAWGLAPDSGWNHPSWSISAEWAAYLAFPVVAAAAWRLRARPASAVAGALALMAALYVSFPLVAHFPLTRATTAWGALRVVPPFLSGCALHLVWRSLPTVSPRTGAIAAGAAALALVVAVQAGAPDGLIVAVGGGLILALGALASAGSLLLASPAWVWLGEVSFAVYMVNAPWQLLGGNLLKRALNLSDADPWPLAAWIAFVALTLPVAAVAHHLVERPARTALRRLGGRRDAGPAPSDRKADRAAALRTSPLAP